MRVGPGAVALFFGLVPAALGAQSIELGIEYPVRGEAVALEIRGEDSAPLAGGRVEVTYRPNSQTAEVESLVADESGRVTWIPKDAGIVRLDASTAETPGSVVATRRVAVRFRHVPASGIVVMVVAGTLLFGGAALAFWLLLSHGVSVADAEPPST